jgi:hypothetical protein
VFRCPPFSLLLGEFFQNNIGCRWKAKIQRGKISTEKDAEPKDPLSIANNLEYKQFMGLHFLLLHSKAKGVSFFGTNEGHTRLTCRLHAREIACPMLGKKATDVRKSALE